MPIITDEGLASYLEVDGVPAPITPALKLKAELARTMISELIYPRGIPAKIPAKVRAIALEVAARAVRNPNGYSSETIDDYTYRRDSDTRAAGVYLTPDERDQLLDTVAKRRQGGLTSIGLISPLDAP